ncbi:MAG: DUF4286 family protein [Chitinophagales bacterium]|nr:DUF4286 family protein [Chitinophagales bacterium]
MLLYNITVKIAGDVEEEWLMWMKEKHTPEVVNAGKFLESKISRLLNKPKGEESTYVIQYLCENLEQYNFYIENFAGALRDEHNAKYKNKFVAFRTLMEIV